MLILGQVEDQMQDRVQRSGQDNAGQAGNAAAKGSDRQRLVVNRLKRARGQLDALIAGIESGAGCRETIVQLAAVSKAIDRAGYVIISNSMQDCLVPQGENADPELTPSELEKLFLMLT